MAKKAKRPGDKLTAKEREQRRNGWLLFGACIILVTGLLIWKAMPSAPRDMKANALPEMTDPSGVYSEGVSGNGERGTAVSELTGDSAGSKDCIQGMTTAGILEGLEQRNFTIDAVGKDRYRCSRTSFGADYVVMVAGSADPRCVARVDASVKADNILKNAQATDDFFQFFAGLQFDGARPGLTYAWMKSDPHGPTMDHEVAGARFSMTMPDRTERRLVIRPADETVAQK